MSWMRSKRVALAAIALTVMAILTFAFLPLQAAAPTTRNYRSIPTTVNVTPINVTGSGTLELIPAQTGPNKTIVILGGELFLSVATTIQFQSGANALTGPESMLAWAKDPPRRDSSGDALAWKETNSGENFGAAVGTSCTIAGELVWYATSQK